MLGLHLVDSNIYYGILAINEPFDEHFNGIVDKMTDICWLISGYDWYQATWWEIQILQNQSFCLRIPWKRSPDDALLQYHMINVSNQKVEYWYIQHFVTLHSELQG